MPRGGSALPRVQGAGLHCSPFRTRATRGLRGAEQAAGRRQAEQELELHAAARAEEARMLAGQSDAQEVEKENGARARARGALRCGGGACGGGGWRVRPRPHGLADPLEAQGRSWR